MPRIQRSEILARFRAMKAQGQPIIGAGEIRVRQIRSCKISVLKFRELEIHIGQFSALEVGVARLAREKSVRIRPMD